MDTRPIGIFDSGLGGLTVVKELLRALPGESIIYFGDTGRVPYGNRSNAAILKYAMQDARFLLKHDVKLIIAACGTVSSVATEIAKELPVPYIGVVKPAAKRAAEITHSGKIGVIGTAATIASGSYKKELHEINPSVRVTARSCPLFVPLVESGFVKDGDPLTTLAAERYLSEFTAEKVDTLILGCTHYPIISGIIKQVLGSKVTLISAGRAAAEAAADLLEKDGILSEKSGEGERRFFVSDMTQSFTEVSSVLLGHRFPMDVRLVDDIDTY
ncbi:MAG TPA: glutamate racemase [Ruminococcaceae bacterium]|nr:glutamate racemase [Oscillospiraceae bacterium]